MAVKHGTISVGMARSHATKLLRDAGAKATRIDGKAPQAGTARAGAVYETRAGSLLVVDYYRAPRAATYHVSGLRLCKDPDVPKSRRVWQDVKEAAV